MHSSELCSPTTAIAMKKDSMQWKVIFWMETPLLLKKETSIQILSKKLLTAPMKPNLLEDSARKAGKEMSSMWKDNKKNN